MGYVQDRSLERPNSKKPFRAWAWNAVAKKRVARSFATWEQADQWWRWYERQLDEGYSLALNAPIERRQSKAPTLLAHGERWIDNEDRESQTKRQYKVSLRAVTYYFAHGKYPDRKQGHTDMAEAHGCELCSRVLVTDPTKAVVEELRGAMLHKVTSGVAGNRLYLLRHVMTNAVDKGLRDDDPTWRVSVSTHIRKKEPVLLTDEQVELVASYMPGPSRLAVWLAADGALRTGEIVGLLAASVNPLKHTMFVGRILLPDGTSRDYTKYGGRKPVPLTKRLASKITEHLNTYGTAKTGELVYNEKNGEAFRPRDFQYRFERARVKAGIPDALIHDNRNRVATRLAANGGNAAQVRDVLRHKGLQAANRYVEQMSQQQLHGALDRALSDVDVESG